MCRYLPCVFAGMIIGIAPSSADDIALPKISVAISLSPKATSKLTELKETVSLSATYFGMAKLGVEGDDAGQIALGNEEAELPQAGMVTLGKIKLRSKDVDKIEGKRLLNINVFTTRKTFADN